MVRYRLVQPCKECCHALARGSVAGVRIDVGAFARAYNQNVDPQHGESPMASAILRITQDAEPPVRLLLGSDAVWLASQDAEAESPKTPRVPRSRRIQGAAP